MKEPALLRSLEKIYHLATRSFLRFIVEAARPVVSSDWDRKVQGYIDAWYMESRGHLAALQRLLEREEFTPGPSHWPLVFAQNNFLQYDRLLEILRPRTKSLLDRIEAESARLSDWPEARTAVKDLLASERRLLEGLEDLLAEKPGEESGDAPRRQVSANWW